MAETPTRPAAESHALAQRRHIPLSVYVHLPWCVRKCPYCDFNSHRLPDTLPEQAYVDALLADWQLARQDDPRPIDTVFFGGGTPSLFTAESIERILAALDRGPGLADACEITLEANPGATEHSRFADLRAAGVNRLSLGIQSLDNACLAALGRIHDADEALAAIDSAGAAGFERLNCDLMFGLPGQTLARAMHDLETVLACDPGHLSYYQLTLEPNTPFYKRPPPLPGDDVVADIFDAATERLAAAGYDQYEVSAWTRPGHGCRHNDNYWRFGDYLGIGAGAHGKCTAEDGRIVRTARQRWPTGYMQAAGRPVSITETRVLTEADARFECLLGALRRRQGLSRDDYEYRTGLSWAELLDNLGGARSNGLIDADDARLAASDRGWYYLDSILAELVPDSAD
ncbi:radical SAM family heme chaperone HemW [Salinisphaera sp. T31B1]|uniref:radical SAM family heme chaperone HemW n=1 Tax=Salinisphaera sp. T31B1 TaxID=727963 RepID=UPI00333FC1BC